MIRRWVGTICGIALVLGGAEGRGARQEQRDFSLRKPTSLQEANWEEKTSACCVRNDGNGSTVNGEDPLSQVENGAPGAGDEEKPAPMKSMGAAPAEAKGAELEAVARRMIAEERVAGASVLVVRRGEVLLHAGYGFADLGLEAPAKEDTVYHVVGPMLPFTGIAVMQLVEKGKLSLDDDISKHIPEFPMQGHRATIRQLLNHTSGIVDYHYLGDPIEATSRQPKALDEVMALYAGKKWVNEPGKKWDWSISGFQLLVTIVERVSGESFADYVQHNILGPVGVKSTTYCDDFTLTRGLARPYRKFGMSYFEAR